MYVMFLLRMRHPRFLKIIDGPLSKMVEDHWFKWLTSRHSKWWGVNKFKCFMWSGDKYFKL